LVLPVFGPFDLGATLSSSSRTSVALSSVKTLCISYKANVVLCYAVPRVCKDHKDDADDDDDDDGRGNEFS
jgi:hypothetical protein